MSRSKGLHANAAGPPMHEGGVLKGASGPGVLGPSAGHSTYRAFPEDDDQARATVLTPWHFRPVRGCPSRER